MDVSVAYYIDKIVFMGESFMDLNKVTANTEEHNPLNSSRGFSLFRAPKLIWIVIYYEYR